mgnify:CR=1 FL=1
MTKEDLHELFEYKDGNLYWKTDRFTKKCMGKKAGSKCKNGYEHIQINYKYIYNHRAIFLYHHGYLPKILDHINGIRDDNRIENLREVTSFQNAWNMKTKLGSSGVKGVTWDKAHKKWLAQLRAKNKKIYIGRFESLEDAEQAYKNHLQLHHGEYTRDGTLL